ncbi:phosphoribosyltransferase [Prolixibacteraceae bacterium JC049]|nr:phosphoribosyltransferase [Prolixibacteraceae bacterium JC049]
MLKKIIGDNQCAIYNIEDGKETRVQRCVISTPETRAICNDPLVMGVNYTRKLQNACSKVIAGLQQSNNIQLEEKETIVFNILRGGLNFGLREAIADAFDWNQIGSSFISAQRARVSKDSEDWHIIESAYKKVYMPDVAQIVIGDVVATGTSLKHGLKALIEQAEINQTHLRSILFFTVGGPITEEILEEVDAMCRKRFPEYEKTTLCYIEGRFEVPSPDTNLNIKITGTDLIRLNALMAPEFVESQYEKPTYPIERCTIYDAGSRAFWLPEYIDDVKHYWEENLKLAENGMTYEELLNERFPLIDASKFAEKDLIQMCEQMVEALNSL